MNYQLEELKWDRLKFLKIKNDAASVCVNPDVVEVMKGVDLKGKIVIDGGCNIGLYALFFAKKIGEKGIVYSFDVQEAMCSLTLKNAKLNNIKNIAIYHKALSSKSGKSVGFTHIDYNGSNPSSVGVKTEPEFAGQSHCGNVQTVALDDMGLENVGLIKLDLEGHEPEALEGMWDTIKKEKPYILIELSPNYLRGQDGVIRRKIEEIGYEAKELSDFNYFFNPV